MPSNTDARDKGFIRQPDHVPCSHSLAVLGSDPSFVSPSRSSPPLPLRSSRLAFSRLFLTLSRSLPAWFCGWRSIVLSSWSCSPSTSTSQTLCSSSSKMKTSRTCSCMDQAEEVTTHTEAHTTAAGSATGSYSSLCARCVLLRVCSGKKTRIQALLRGLFGKGVDKVKVLNSKPQLSFR